MCYCTPERRTPFCQDCAWKLTTENAALKAELAEARHQCQVANQEHFDMEQELEALKAQDKDVMEAIELYELALKASWPEGAMGAASDYWEMARGILEESK